MIDDKLPAGSTRRYRLTGGAAAGPPAAKVSAMMGDHDLLLAVGPLPVLRYQHAVMPSADPELPYYARSGFIHPVYDPRKRMLTDSMPADHMHQHGLMFAWVNTTFEGRKMDFWNSKLQQAEVRHAGFDGYCSGPVFAAFTARLDHIDRTAPGGPKTVLHETWEIRVYNRADGFLFDLRSTQNCAGSEPLVINKYDYGGMCIRGTSAWLEAGQSDFLTSEGKNRREGNHTRPLWCDLSGQLEGQASGITCFCHPANFRYPQPVRLHPSKPYFCWAPMVLGPFAIEPGKPSDVLRLQTLKRRDHRTGNPAGDRQGRILGRFRVPHRPVGGSRRRPLQDCREGLRLFLSLRGRRRFFAPVGARVLSCALSPALRLPDQGPVCVGHQDAPMSHDTLPDE
jgi:hypothetical protein